MAFHYCFIPYLRKSTINKVKSEFIFLAKNVIKT